ncbi:MAG: hypothetical protein HGA39_09710 [Coriobacteriia bacterium]|nr:hypothetical protein [Coriobacteriia bacterium]
MTLVYTLLFVAALVGIVVRLHQGFLAVRLRAAAKTGCAASISTRPADILRLGAVAAVVSTALSAVSAMIAPGSGVIELGLGLFAGVFLAGIYWRYPAAAPVAITAPDWETGEVGGYGIMRIARYLWASMATALACGSAFTLVSRMW